MTDLVTLGEGLGLFVKPGIGPMRVADRVTFSFAGAEGNVAIGMSRLGHSTAMIGRVGDDPPGRVIADGLRAEGVDVSRILVDERSPTGVMLREHRTADRVTVTYFRHGSAGSRLAAGDVDDRLVSRSRVLHITGITLGISASARAAVLRAVRVARSAGVRVSLDVNHRSMLWSRRAAGAVLRPLLPDVDVLFGGEEELNILTDASDITTMARTLAEAGPAEVVVKCGERGAFACIGGTMYEELPLPVTSADPVGAGDAFVAGYLSAWLDGQDPAALLHRGAICGAFVVSSPGDWEGLPRRSELNLLDGDENVRR